MILTDKETNQRTENSKYPEGGGKSRDEIEQATEESTNIKRYLASELVRYRTHGNATNEMAGKDDRGRDKGQRATVTHQVKLKI